MNQLQMFAQTKIGLLIVLTVAAGLEVYGDSCFQNALYLRSGARRAVWFIAGTAVLAAYSLFLNSSRLDFGRLLGVYVVLFFVMAQIIAAVKFGEQLSLRVLAGGALIVAGGVVMLPWRL
jgi:drug/metabolite transporter superfamily protein YnfA